MYNHFKLTFFIKKTAELLLVGHLLQRLAEQAGGLRASGGKYWVMRV